MDPKNLHLGGVPNPKSNFYRKEQKLTRGFVPLSSVPRFSHHPFLGITRTTVYVAGGSCSRDHFSLSYLCFPLFAQTFFVKAGIFMLLEKLKTVAFRNLFKKVWGVFSPYEVHFQLLTGVESIVLAGFSKQLLDPWHGPAPAESISDCCSILQG